MAKQMNRLFLVFAVILSFAGCGDTTQEIPMLDGSVVIKPFKVQDLPGLPMGYYQFYFRDLGVYTVVIEVKGNTFYKLTHRVTNDPDSKMRYYGKISLSRAIADISVTSPDNRTAKIQYDMGRRRFDEDNVGVF